METHIICPSGLAGNIRGLKIKEGSLFTDRKLLRQGLIVEKVLGRCWIETTDPGPYDFGEKGIDWGKVLQGDRFFALLQMRVATYGPQYAFGLTCQNDVCRERFEWELDLMELPVKKLPTESAENFKNGNRFETVLPGAGRKVWFRLLTGEDERKFPALRSKADGNLMTALFTFRIVEIEGVKPQEKNGFVEDLELSDAMFLRSEFDRADCSVETTIEVECPHCLTVQEIDLPFEKTFFLAEAGKKTREGR
jgi:phage FluMu protein Com